MLKIISKSYPEDVAGNLSVGICAEVEKAEVISDVHVDKFRNLNAKADSKIKVHAITRINSP